MEKLISIIVPVYNAEKYIDRCINSILRQTYENIEVILVNDGSTDRSPDICDKYAAKNERIKVIHKTNGGVASARNAGIKAAKGDYIGFMDNDDYIQENMYEILEREISKNNAYIVKILINFVDEEGHVIGVNESQNEYIKIINAKDYLKSIMLQKGDVACWSKLFKREIFERYSFLEGRWNEDFLLMFKIMNEVESMISINEYTYNYVQRKGSYSKSGFNQGIIDNVVNANWAIEYLLENDVELVEYAYRLFFHQSIPYLMFLPIKEMTPKNKVFIMIRIYLKNNIKNWLFNKHLTIKERLLLVAFFICPRFFRKSLEKINYKNYYQD